MNTYTKLFHSILDSTVWQEDLETRVVWITMLAMTDKDGVIQASVPGLASRAKVTLEGCLKALTKFREPDPWSRTKEHEGRRIEEVDGGWRILNHGHYRQKMSAEDRKEYQRLKQAEYRAKKKKAVAVLPPDPGDLDENGHIRRENILDKVAEDIAAEERARAKYQPDYEESEGI